MQRFLTGSAALPGPKPWQAATKVRGKSLQHIHHTNLSHPCSLSIALLLKAAWWVLQRPPARSGHAFWAPEAAAPIVDMCTSTTGYHLHPASL